MSGSLVVLERGARDTNGYRWILSTLGGLNSKLQSRLRFLYFYYSSWPFSMSGVSSVPKTSGGKHAWKWHESAYLVNKAADDEMYVLTTYVCTMQCTGASFSPQVIFRPIFSLLLHRRITLLILPASKMSAITAILFFRAMQLLSVWNMLCYE